MKKYILPVLLLCHFTVLAQNNTETYALDPASTEQAGVPKGEVLKLTFENSRVFPGTWREYFVYIPSQYDGKTPACVYVNQDGVQWNAPTVFDNLIHQKQMPVTIGVFVTPGRIRASNPDLALDRFNRSAEFDALGDAYARFILEEILPEVEKQKTSDGRRLLLSKNGNDRAIGGSSTGAVAAFTVAWERPQEFSRVFSVVGTYVGLRGAEQYPTLIRKVEPKGFRVFLQDGTNDLNIYAGDWWKANESMERALSFAGYDVNHIWGEGGHNNRHGTAIFPEAMRWLWRDWPQPVTRGTSNNGTLKDILIPGEEWEIAGQGYGATHGLAVNGAGEVFFQDAAGRTWKVNPGGNITALAGSGKINRIVFGAGGKRFVVSATGKEISQEDTSGKTTTVMRGVKVDELVATHGGNIYAISRDAKALNGKIFLIRSDGSATVVDDGPAFAKGITLTPDQEQLYVTDPTSHLVLIYRILGDGKLAYKQKYGWLHTNEFDQYVSGADGVKCDRAGRVYVATRMGIQILDQIGKVQAILPVPGGKASAICFGGPGFDVLYVAAGDKLYRRKLKTQGVNTFDAPFKPATPRL